jgi:hypothetical protein
MTIIKEGDFVMCPEGYEDKPLVGQVEYVMTEGMFGIPGSEYAIEASMEEPAILVRHFEEEDGVWEAEMILSGHKASMLVKIESLKVERDVVSEEFSSTDSEVGMAMYDSSIGKAKKPNYGAMIKPRSSGSTPSNPKLYARVVQAAKDKFEVYPSAVANSWVVQEYKRRGGTYKFDSAPETKSVWDGSFDPKGFIK